MVDQNYSNFEVIVLDDNSEDDTPTILRSLQHKNSKLIVTSGLPKPNDWLGKPWACHQLSKKASGDILVFVDADVWMEHDVISKVAEKLKSTDTLTIWPQQQLESFWERLIIPSIYFSLLTLLPSKYVERSPRWMPTFLRPTINPKFTAGCGQFFAFNRPTYEGINGHESVKNHVVEDIELAKIIKKSGKNLTMMNGINSVHCRMYTSRNEVWQGFQKNFLSGFNTTFEFLFMGALHFLFFLFPVFSLIQGLINGNNLVLGLSVAIVGLYTIQRLMLNVWFGWNLMYSFLHPLAVLWFQVLGLKCLINKLFGFKSTWKGRSV